MTPRTAVVILNWNGWRDTVACVKSIVSGAADRIIVVDNASTDASVEQLSLLGDLEIIQTSRNLGFSGGNNVGIMYALSQGYDFVWLLNNDTLLRGGEMESFVAFMERHPDAGIVGGTLYEYPDSAEVQAVGGGRLNVPLALTDHYKVSGRTPQHIIGACMFIRSQVFRDIGLLDNDYFFFMEDTDFSIRARQHGWKLLTNEETRIVHKGGASLSGRSDVKDTYYVISNAIFLKKHSSLFFAAVKYLLIMVNRLRRGNFGSLKRIYKGFWSSYLNATRKV